MALMVSTASWPCARGLVIPNSASSAARKDSGIFPQIPMTGPVTLGVGVATEPGTPRHRVADHPLEQQEIGCMLRGVQGAKLVGDQLECRVPADRCIVAGTGPKHHRVSEGARWPSQ